MLQMIYSLLFIGASLFVLTPFLLTRKAGASTRLFKEESLLPGEEEFYKTTPAEFLQHLRFSVRYSPGKKRFASGRNYVCLEEQLRYGNIPLTGWIKHDVPKEGFPPSPQVLRIISLLKHYDPKKAVPIVPRLDVIAGGGR